MSTPHMGSVLVERSDGAVVVLMRDRFLSAMAGPHGYGRSLYHRHPVEQLVDDAPWILAGDLFLDDAEQALLARAPCHRYDDLAVRLPDGSLGVVTVADLLSRLSSQYAHAAQHDPLTDLANRSRFQHCLAQALRAASGPERARAVLFIDVDRFKDVNDSLGHDAGDTLLVELARRLAEVVRPGDVVARYSGDEFAILLAGNEPGQAPDAPTAVAERLLRLLQLPIRVQDRDVLVGVSIGIVDLESANAQDPEELVRLADLAMYRAKAAGGARYASYNAQMSTAAGDQLELESGLRGAVAAGEFFLCYQPKVLVDRGEIVAAEALIRWQRPGIGTLPPDAFIPIAERTGLIVPIGRWVLHEACRQAAQWHAAHPDRRPLVICVNVSARQLTASTLLDDVADALSANGLAPASLCLEVTETAVADDAGAALAVLARLRALGVGVAIDDFGTGYSSLWRVGNLPADELKIDRSFVKNLGAGGTDESVVGHILDLARTCGMLVTAEGVETEEQLAVLRKLGCEFVQGYLTGRPLTATEFDVRLLQAGGGSRGRAKSPSGDDAGHFTAD